VTADGLRATLPRRRTRREHRTAAVLRGQIQIELQTRALNRLIRLEPGRKYPCQKPRRCRLLLPGVKPILALNDTCGLVNRCADFQPDIVPVMPQLKAKRASARDGLSEHDLGRHCGEGIVVGWLLALGDARASSDLVTALRWIDAAADPLRYSLQNGPRCPGPCCSPMGTGSPACHYVWHCCGQHSVTGATPAGGHADGGGLRAALWAGCQQADGGRVCDRARLASFRTKRFVPSGR
jgi:hypothetical protein